MRHTSKLKTFAWYSVVTLLVTFAILVSVIRLTIGSVSEYRHHLEAAAGRYLGQPVTISGMDARLVGFRPTVLLDEVSLLEKESKEPIAHFKQIAIALNPLSSLRQLQPIIDLSISGAHIVLGMDEEGAFRVQGVSVTPETQAGSEGGSGALGTWFLSQARLALLDSKVVWRDFETGDEMVFSGVNLELQNLENRHRLSALVKLPETVGKSLRLSLDIHGNLLNRKDWQGELYLKAEQLYPAPLLHSFDYKGLHLQQGQVDLELWSLWEGGLLRGVEGEFDLADLVLRDDNDVQALKRLAGRLRYEEDDDGWQLQLARLKVQPDDKPVESLALALQHDDEGTTLQATALPLVLIQRYGPYLPQLNKPQREWLLNASPDGWIRDIRLALSADKPLKATAKLEKLQLGAWKRYPGVKGLSGYVSVDWPQAVLVLDSEQMTIELPRLFRRPLPVERVTGVVRMQKEGGQWRMAATTMQLSTPDISADLSFDGWLSPGEAPLLSLSARVSDGRVASVPDYLPARIMSEGSVNWLDHAFVKGGISSGTVLIHGRLDAFPFYARQGRFEVALETEGVTLHYQDDWPDLFAVAGEVNFDGGGMSIDARRARVFGASLRRTRVAIEDFRRPLLKVAGVANASVNDALRFLRTSPLAKSADKALATMQGEGETRIDLDLTIPISRAMAEVSPLSANGKVAFQECSLEVANGVILEALQGELSFANHLFEAEDIAANLYGHPAKITVFSRQADEDNAGRTVITAQGHAEASALQKAFDKPLLQRLSGDTDWQAQLSIEQGKDADIALTIHSTLEGMVLDLPPPAAKSRDAVRPFSLTWQLSGEGLHTHRLRYGDLAKAVWQYESGAYHLRRAGLLFGAEGEPKLPKQAAIHIAGRLERFSPRAWAELRKELARHTEGAPPARHIEGAPLVELPPIELEMEYLQLVADSAEPQAQGEGGGGLHTVDVPPMTVDVKSFAYGDLALGNLAFKVRPLKNSVFFDDLKLHSRHFSLNGKGRWDEGGSSRFEVELAADNLGRMMRGLGFSSIISGGKTSAKGALTWLGEPSAFSLAHLGGELHTSIEDGVIEEVEPGAGKLLGLLSLQALPRRLFLDFSDLSGKGLQFDSIEGDIRFADGSAYTQNLHLKSLPANVLVTGRTGLVQKDFDQLIAVVPNVSDTVSVAGALAWGPQAAAILLVLQKLFQSDIDAATMIRYELAGSWENPKLTKLEPLQPLPAQEIP